MNEQVRSNRETYRLIIVKENGSEMLLRPSGSGSPLPSVEVVPRQRIAEQLTGEVHGVWGIRACCLFIPRFVTSDQNTERVEYAVMESLDPNDRVPAGFSWAPTEMREFHPADADLAAVRSSLVELDSYAKDPRNSPFGRLGWTAELLSWAQYRIDPWGERLSGSFRQLNASPTFSLIRLETTGGAVWFKATGEPNLHELPISLCVARLFPGSVPTILGVHPSWNGWLSREVPGAILEDATELAAWERVATDLAHLQIASIGKEVELFEGSSKDLRLSVLTGDIDPFLARMAELMTLQEGRIPRALTRSELGLIGSQLQEACSVLAATRLPDTLGHIDFNPGNILVSPERSVFLDWAEGSVTNPLITFEYFCEHLGQSVFGSPAAAQRVTAAYTRPWLSLFSQQDFKSALAVAPLVAVFACAVSKNDWRTSPAVLNPALAGYLRSLTRRMYREAAEMAKRSERCLV
jgi:hypothetical protein